VLAIVFRSVVVGNGLWTGKGGSTRTATSYNLSRHWALVDHDLSGGRQIQFTSRGADDHFRANALVSEPKGAAPSDPDPTSCGRPVRAG